MVQEKALSRTLQVTHLPAIPPLVDVTGAVSADDLLLLGEAGGGPLPFDCGEVLVSGAGGEFCCLADAAAVLDGDGMRLGSEGSAAGVKRRCTE